MPRNESSFCLLHRPSAEKALAKDLREALGFSCICIKPKSTNNRNNK
jgi:hypothetical protein